MEKVVADDPVGCLKKVIVLATNFRDCVPQLLERIDALYCLETDRHIDLTNLIRATGKTFSPRVDALG
jgi:hypothetical protein